MSWFGTEKQWHKIAESELELDFDANSIAVANIQGKKICIGKYQGKRRAFSYKCPHAGGLMSAGYIDALGNAVCPLHRYKFCLANGRNVSGEGYFLKTATVKVEDEGVFVEGIF